MEIIELKDLNQLRSAPYLLLDQRILLMREVDRYINDFDWCTVGIMADSSDIAIKSIREMERYFNWDSMNIVNQTRGSGPVYLKANQKTGDIYVRIEHGLGQGIIVSCHSNNELTYAETFGPLPLDFFSLKFLPN